jgi:hypothetical protein
VREVLAGFDLTFSVPKSVAVPWGIADAATLDGRWRSLEIAGVGLAIGTRGRVPLRSRRRSWRPAEQGGGAREHRLGRLTPIEFELIMSRACRSGSVGRPGVSAVSKCVDVAELRLCRCACPERAVSCGARVKGNGRPAPVHVRPYRSPPAWGDSRRDRCRGRPRGGDTCCGALPAARMAGRLPTRTPANLGANPASGRFVGARWSILASHSEWIRERGRTTDRSTAGPLKGMSGCSPLLGDWALDLLVCAGERVGRAAIGMHRALGGGRMGDVVCATCCPPVGRLLDVVAWNRQSSYGAGCSTRASSRLGGSAER